MALAKAKLKVIENKPGGPEEVEFLFNPKELKINATAQWEQPKQGGAPKGSKGQYKGPGPRTVDFQIVLDEWDMNGSTGYVVRTVETLVSWTRPTPQSRNQKTPQAPIVQLVWGGPVEPARCGLTKVATTFNLFHHDTGKPLRATVDISMTELPSEPGKQNPTSGSLTSRRSHLVVEGDSLQSIAWREYRDVSYWRGLAVANGIDDPLRVRPGRRIHVPDIDEARDLSRLDA